MEVDPSVIAQLHNPLVPDLENSDDSASDEEDFWGWEAVSHTSVSYIHLYYLLFPANGNMIRDACIHIYTRYYIHVGTKYCLSRNDSTYFCDGQSTIF